MKSDRRKLFDLLTATSRTAALNTALLCERIVESKGAATLSAKRIAGGRVDAELERLAASFRSLSLIAAALLGQDVRVSFGADSGRRRKQPLKGNKKRRGDRT